MGNKENNIKKPGFKTLSIHHGETFAEETGCVMPPIFSTSTFKHGNKDNFDYTRSGNPNFRILENILKSCLLYTSPSPRDRQKSRMPSSA